MNVVLDKAYGSTATPYMFEMEVCVSNSNWLYCSACATSSALPLQFLFRYITQKIWLLVSREMNGRMEYFSSFPPTVLIQVQHLILCFSLLPPFLVASNISLLKLINNFR